MNNIQEPVTLRVVQGTNPVAVTRAYAKARFGDQTALRWLQDEHRRGNTAATKALLDLERLMPAQPASVA
jgi:hypothetical protein